MSSSHKTEKSQDRGVEPVKQHRQKPDRLLSDNPCGGDMLIFMRQDMLSFFPPSSSGGKQINHSVQKAQQKRGIYLRAFGNTGLSLSAGYRITASRHLLFSRRKERNVNAKKITFPILRRTKTDGSFHNPPIFASAEFTLSRCPLACGAHSRINVYSGGNNGLIGHRIPSDGIRLTADSHVKGHRNENTMSHSA